MGAAREALGMPVPPVSVVKAGAAVRRGLMRAEERSTVPFQLVLERLFGLIDAKAIYSVVELGVPEALAQGPMTVPALAAATGADADVLARVLRYLSSRGLFKQRRDGRYENNGATDVLRSDHPYSWRDWALFMGGDWNTRIWDAFPARLRGQADATVEAHGCDFFTYVNERNPAAGAAFNGAQAAGSRVQGAIFAEHVDLDGVRTMCDVGGGSGSVLSAVLKAHPAITGTVLDLPALESDALATFKTAGIEDRASFTAGNFFASVPAGFDLYTMFAVAHDWGDDECVEILSNVRKALPPNGRVMVVDGHVAPTRGADFIKAADMLMLAYTTGGRERTLAEFDALFGRAGLTQRRRVTLPSLFDVFELWCPTPSRG